TSLITVKDSSGRTRTLTTTWTIFPPPTVTLSAATFSLMQNWTVAYQQVGYSCPTQTCTLALATGGPAGIGLSATPTGTPAASIAVTSATGNVYLTGTDTSGAGSYTVKVTPTDTKYSKTGAAATATWTVVTPGAGLNNLTVTRGTAIPTQTLNWACASACTVGFAGTLGAATLSGNWLAPDPALTPATATLAEVAGKGTFYVRGTPSTGNAAGSYAMLITITDASGSQLTEPATWTVK
ncbi:MAG TPA: hypothetical protein VMB79_03440, partial [Jatrophihabitans sp.]|nr:hypothetical protein [Jatrophihabitans sp.]